MRLPRLRSTVRRVMTLVALAGVLMASVVLFLRSSEAAHGQTCRNNLLMLALGLINCETSLEAFPTATVSHDRLPPERRLSWLVEVSPFLDQWFWILDRAAPWDAEVNRVTRGHGTEGAPQAVGRIAGLTCPAASGSADEHMPGWTWYVGIAGVGIDAPTLPEGHPRAGVFGHDRRVGMGGIKDGASNTLMLAETDLSNGPWTAGGPATVRGLDPARQPYIGRGRQFGGLHRGGLNVAFADGSVRAMNQSIDPRVFEALATVAGGEPLPAGWDR